MKTYAGFFLLLLLSSFTIIFSGCGETEQKQDPSKEIKAITEGIRLEGVGGSYQVNGPDEGETFKRLVRNIDEFRQIASDMKISPDTRELYNEDYFKNHDLLVTNFAKDTETDVYVTDINISENNADITITLKTPKITGVIKTVQGVFIDVEKGTLKENADINIKFESIYFDPET